MLKLCPVIRIIPNSVYSDNGNEFSNPKAIEYGPDGMPITRIFYCDPSSPYKKESIEVNHALLRNNSKRDSMDELTQEDTCLLMNHVNSNKRRRLNDKSPNSAFSFYHGEDILYQLGCSPVAPEDITLKPKPLKK